MAKSQSILHVGCAKLCLKSLPQRTFKASQACKIEVRYANPYKSLCLPCPQILFHTAVQMYLSIFMQKYLFVLVPLVSRILPSDICKIHKRGSSIRLDTTLVDFNDMRWERGDITFLLNGQVKPSQSLAVLDNKSCLYQRVRYEVCRHSIYFLYILQYMGFVLIYLRYT